MEINIYNLNIKSIFLIKDKKETKYIIKCSILEYIKASFE